MVRALIVIDIAFYRQGLQELLTKSGEVVVVGAASNAEETENIVRRERPDVVLIDVGGRESAEALRRARRIEPAPRIVALAISETPESVIEWAESGIAGYVPRDASLADLIRVLKGVVRDELYCSRRIAATMIRRLAALAATSRRSNDPVGELPAREHEVLSLIARGLSNKAIASHLGIANATAKNHVHNILDKLFICHKTACTPASQAHP